MNEMREEWVKEEEQRNKKGSLNTEEQRERHRTSVGVSLILALSESIRESTEKKQ